MATAHRPPRGTEPGPLAEKARRRREILRLLAEEEIGSQAELVRALARRGHPVTQATLSRDLRELGVARVPVEDGYRWSAGGQAPEAPAEQLREVAALEVVSIDSNEVGVVIRTLVGRAQGVAVWIDGLKSPEVLGTIAGDDTILVLPRSIKRTARLRASLARLLGLDEARGSGAHPKG